MHALHGLRRFGWAHPPVRGRSDEHAGCRVVGWVEDLHDGPRGETYPRLPLVGRAIPLRARIEDHSLRWIHRNESTSVDSLSWETERPRGRCPNSRQFASGTTCVVALPSLDRVRWSGASEVSSPVHTPNLSGERKRATLVRHVRGHAPNRCRSSGGPAPLPDVNLSRTSIATDSCSGIQRSDPRSSESAPVSTPAPTALSAAGGCPLLGYG